MRYELLSETGYVTNTIEASAMFMEDTFPVGTYRLSETQDPAVEYKPPIYEKYIDLGPFYDRFGSAKLPVLTSTDAGVKAIISDLNIRKWVDLARPDVAEALQYVGTVVPAVTVQLQDTILNTPVSNEENLALRKLYFS